MRKAIVSWSGGKDSALALLKILESGEFQVISLVCGLTENTQKSTIHQIPKELLAEQAKALGLPIYFFEVAEDLKNYKQTFGKVLSLHKNIGATAVVFGDLESSGVRPLREELLADFQMELILPLWGKSSENIMEEYLNSGLKSVIIVVQTDKLSLHNVGKLLDQSTISKFPKSIDICGELGEYHSFCYDGSIFKKPVKFETGELTTKTYEIGLSNGKLEKYKFCYAPFILDN